jgi:phosphoglucomutase
MTISLKSPDALEPHLSATTVRLHRDLHEAGYVERVNRLVSCAKLANCSLEQILTVARELDDHASKLANTSRLVAAHYTDRPDPAVAAQRVAFATSGHQGSALQRNFNEAHALSLSQAICDYRTREGIYGPVFLGIDTNALSMLAFATALEVLAANDIEVLVTSNDEHLPAHTVASAILTYNRGRADGLADGIVIASPHERREDGGFEYISPHSRSPDVHAAHWIDNAANEYLRWGPSSIRRRTYDEAARGSAALC